MKKTGFSKKTLRSAGLNNSINDMVPSISELLKSTPASVNVKAELSFTQEVNGHRFRVNKNDKLIMPINLYDSTKRARDTNQLVYSLEKKKFKDLFKRYQGQNLDNKKLLIWRGGGIGDILFSQPIVKYLKEKYPTCQITYATFPNNAALLTCWPKGLLDYATIIPFTTEALTKHDYHLTFEGSIERCKEAEKLNCYDIFQKMAGVKFNPEDYPISLTPLPSIDIAVKNSLRDLKVVLLQTRASSKLRSLPLSLTEIIAKRLQDLGFFVGIQDSYENSDYVKHMILSMKSINHARTLNLASISADVAHAVAIGNNVVGGITTDSAFSHILPALGKPVVTIFGPFKGELRMKYYKHADWVETEEGWNECGKHPCFLHESKVMECPFVKNMKTPGCLSAINIDDVISKFVKVHNEVYTNDQLLV